MLKLVIIILLIFVIICAGWSVYHYNIDPELVTVYYTLEENVAAPIRIVQLSDLHNAEFGEGNSELIGLVEEQSPDLIVMTGDMLNRYDENTDIVCNLISSLNEIAPVYFGYGNHEKEWENNFGQNLTEFFTEAGAVVIDCSYVDIEVNDAAIRIAGYMPYYRQPGMYPVDEAQRQLELDFADDFENTDRLKILLNHIPTQWVDWDYIDEYPVDVVFSGHYHGGVIQIPLVNRGLYCPYVGFFAPNTKGLFKGTKATCVLSSELGSEYAIPRLNNPAELVVVDLIPVQ